MRRIYWRRTLNMNDRETIFDNGNVKLQQEQISPFSLDFNLEPIIKEVWSNLEKVPEHEASLIIKTLTNHHDSFIKAFKSVEYFQRMEIDGHKAVLTTVQEIAKTSFLMERFGEGIGSTVFQLWLIAVIRKEKHHIDEIERLISKYRNKHNQ